MYGRRKQVNQLTGWAKAKAKAKAKARAKERAHGAPYASIADKQVTEPHSAQEQPRIRATRHHGATEARVEHSQDNATRVKDGDTGQVTVQARGNEKEANQART